MHKKTLKINNEDCKEAAINAFNLTAHSAVLIKEYTRDFGEMLLTNLIDRMQSKHKKINLGNLEDVEEMLFDQANVLQAIFSKLASNAPQASFRLQMDTYLRLALKAQAQCNRMLATLHTMKSPSVVSFIKKANIGENIQINNSSVSSQDAQEKISKASNKLLEEPHNGTRMDSRATHEAISSHPHLEAVR